MKMKSYYTFFYSFFLLIIFSYAGVSAQESQGWTVKDPFNQKVFIENKGQFTSPFSPLSRGRGAGPARTFRFGTGGGEVLFGATVDGVEMFFSTKGITYRHNEIIQAEENEKQENGKEKMKIIPHSISMEWIGANRHVQIVAEEAVANYFTYPDLNDKTGRSSLKASACKKIIYKNIYPNIDVEYIFPQDSSGIKYSLILRPGANSSDIKMKWSGNDLFKDEKGDMIIKSPFGKFIDHAPKTFYENGNAIPSAFEISGSTVSFKLDVLPSSIKPLPLSIIIDPWTTTPVFAQGGAYEVDYDYAGNVYVFGGVSPSFTEIKYNSAGVMQWSFNASNVLGTFYNDIAVDRNTGISYIVQGSNLFGSAIAIQISTGGAQTNSYSLAASMNEMWRIVYNNCSKKCVVAGGGTTGSFQAAVLDPANGFSAPVNVLGAATSLHDLGILCSDNTSSNCYMGSTRSFQYPALFDNVMMKCPIPSLTPVYTVPDNHKFYEDSYGSFYIKRYSSICGWNGMAVSAKYLYTYDGKKIQRWNKNTGAFMNNALVTAAPDTFLWGGVSVDDCDHIFAGVKASVVQYDTNFTVIATTPMATGTDTVYDVQFAPGNKLYVSGNNFVSFFQLGGIVCNPASSFSITTSSSGSCSASATATVTGGTGPYTYIWNPSGQTTATATGLTSGTYTVTVSDNSCNPPQTATVTVAGSTTSVSITSSPASCLSPTGSATVTVNTGTPSYTYQWSPSGGNSSAATGLSAGNYTVLVTDGNGCTTTKTVTVNSSSGISATMNSAPSTCTSPTGSATVTPTGGTNPYTYLWNTSPAQSSQTATGLSSGTYSVLITDGSGCTTTATVAITSAGGITATVNSTQSSCSSPTGTATANPTSGSAPYSYVWITSPAQNTQTATGLGVGIYSVTITDSNGCTATQSVTITAAGGPTTTASAAGIILCNGGNNGSAAAAAAGGSAPYTYSWSNGQTTSAASGLTAGNYSVVVTDASGCSAVAAITISQPAPITSITPTTPDTCSSSLGTASAAASGGTSPYDYLWSNGQTSQTANGLLPGTYSVLITDANGCTHSAAAIVGNTGGAGANAGPNVIITSGDSTVLTASGGVTYSWSTGETTNPITVAPTVTTVYTVTVTDAKGCSAIDSVVVFVLEPTVDCSGLEAEDLFFLPNAFSPDKNGQNDRFHLLSGKYFYDCLTGFYIAIYNRWGEKIFEGTTINFSWDGTYKDKPEGTAVFAYYIEAAVKNGDLIKQKGNVSLLR